MAELQTTQATGKRKTAIAQVRLRPGTGIITVNHKALDEYFTRESQCISRKPLRNMKLFIFFVSDGKMGYVDLMGPPVGA